MREVLILLRPLFKEIANNKIVLVVAVIFGLGFTLLSGVGYVSLFHFLSVDPRFNASLNQLLAETLLGVSLTLFSLVLYTNLSGQKFTGSDDLVLLSSLPIQTSKVFVVKFIRLLFIPLLFALLFVFPLGLGLVIGLAKPIWFYPLALLLFFGLLLVPFTLGSMLTIVVSFTFGKPRLKEFGFVVSLIFTLFIIAPRYFVEPLQPIVTLLTNQIFNFIFPTGWIANAFLTNNFLVSLFWSSLFICFSYFIVFASLKVSQSLYYSGLTTSYSRKTKSPTVAKSKASSSTPTIALLKKDLVTMFRNPSELLRLAPVLIVVLIGVVHFEGPKVDFFGSSLDANAIMSSFFFIFMVPISTLAIVGREGKGVWLLRATPLTSFEFIRSKLFTAYTLTFAQILIFLVFSFFRFHFSFFDLLTFSTVVTLSCLSLTAVDFGLSAWFPRYDWDNPQQQVKPFVSIAAFIGNFVFIYTGVYLIAWAPMRILTIPLALAIAVGLPLFLIQRSIRKYDRLQIS